MKYNVYARRIFYEMATVEADNEDEAIEKAYGNDDGNIEIVEVEACM